jgi:hypothetical protein
MSKASLVILISFLFLPACYEPVEGCLDPAALNYDISADKDCCCEYPNLVLSIEHVIFDTLTFRFGDTLSLNGQAVIFNRFQFFLSDIHLKVGANTRSVDDQLTFLANTGGGGTEEVKETDDFLLASRNTNTYEVGTFPYPGNYDSLSLFLGLNPPAQFAIPESFPDGHPLSITSDSMYVDGNYQMLSIELVRFLPQADTLQLEVSEPLRLALGKPDGGFLQVLNGFDATLPLKIAYDDWLRDVNFTGGKQQIVDQIVKNTSNAFSLQH